MRGSAKRKRLHNHFVPGGHTASNQGQMYGSCTCRKNHNLIPTTYKQLQIFVIGKEKLSEYTANIAFAGFTAPKILWVKENEPENFAKIAKIMLPKDYIAYKMTGVHSCDYSDASGMLLLDVKNKCWSKEMMEICDVKEEQLPKLFESYEVTGSLTKEAAAALGLTTNCKIAAGAGDNAAAAVGTGTVGDGGCNISLLPPRQISKDNTHRRVPEYLSSRHVRASGYS